MSVGCVQSATVLNRPITSTRLNTSWRVPNQSMAVCRNDFVVTQGTGSGRVGMPCKCADFISTSLFTYSSALYILQNTLNSYLQSIAARRIPQAAISHLLVHFENKLYAATTIIEQDHPNTHNRVANKMDVTTSVNNTAFLASGISLVRCAPHAAPSVYSDYDSSITSTSTSLSGSTATIDFDESVVNRALIYSIVSNWWIDTMTDRDVYRNFEDESDEGGLGDHVRDSMDANIERSTTWEMKGNRSKRNRKSKSKIVGRWLGRHLCFVA
jgi:hypothetical protein